MVPDAIIVFSGGIITDDQGHWHSTTYEHSDGFGTLGGRDRIEAAAFLATKYPTADVVTTSHRLGRVRPSLADVYAQELHMLGVDEKRIIKEERSSTTQTAVNAALQLALEKGWKQLVFVSSGFHLPRIEAFYRHAKSSIEVRTVSAESVLELSNPAFGEYFEKVKKYPAYQTRLAAERRGIQALEDGTYQAARAKDKKERAM